MKYLSLLLLLFCFRSYSQGNEDCRTKLVYNGYSGTAYSFTIYNKTTCATKYRVILPHGMREIETETIQGNSYSKITFVYPLCCGVLKIIPETVCKDECPLDWIQSGDICEILPVKFESLTVKDDGYDIIVSFVLSQITNVKSFTIKTTTDNVNFISKVVKDVSVLQAGVPYIVKFKKH